MHTNQLIIALDRQRLHYLEAERRIACFPVSTGANGIGEQMGSGCTPRGRHRICARIGEGCPENSVFVARRPTGEVWSEALAQAFPDRDWILTRILWLHGLEPGFNRGGERDSRRRFIYIHGTPHITPLGRPGSKGCIRMANADLLWLFERVGQQTQVQLLERDPWP